jgi:uracil-DNA glycosylase
MPRRESDKAEPEPDLFSFSAAARAVPQPDAAADANPDAFPSLAATRKAAAHCERCPLYRNATQTVFGEGPADAPLVFVGEQPGDQEDLQGRPFVGPAGQMFDRALAEAGIDRARVYVTNAVKHFKFEPRGKRRIHQKPNNDEIEICRWWLDQELHLIKPRITVALGATAARALTGRDTTIARARGRLMALRDGTDGFITVHPSFLLRLPDEAAKAREYARFVDDLRRVAQHLPEIRAVA